MKRKTTVAIIAIALAAAGQAWRAASATRETTAAVAAAREAGGRSEREALSLEQKIGDARHLRAGLQAERQRLGAALANPPIPAGSGAAMTPPNPQNSPEQQARMLQRFKTRLPLEYSSLYRALKLSPGQIAKFEALLVEREGRRRDILATAQEGGLPASDPAIANLRRAEDERFQAALTDLSGVDGYRQWQDFERTADERRTIRELAGNLAFTPTPLTAAQAGQLMEVLKAPDSRWATNKTFRWDVILPQAQGFLSAPQLMELQSQGSAGKWLDSLNDFIDQTRKSASAKPPGK